MATRIHVERTDDGIRATELTPLSEDELAVLAYIPGHTNKQIAALLGVRPITVQKRISSILYTLNVQSRTEAVVHALERGWIAGYECTYNSVKGKKIMHDDQRRYYHLTAYRNGTLKEAWYNLSMAECTNKRKYCDAHGYPTLKQITNAPYMTQESAAVFEDEITQRAHQYLSIRE
jgi:DNA-binding CsgD family transcriptional regulator